jgi:Xaa-Pro aminopeptidase
VDPLDAEHVAAYRPHYPRFSDAEYARRFRLVREAMAAHGVDCLVVTGSPGMNAELMADVHWLSNWNHTAAPGFVVLPSAAEPTLYCGLFVYRENALQRSVLEDVRVGVDVGARIVELGLERGTIGLVGSCPHELVDGLRARFPAATLMPAGEWFGELRRARSDEEMAWIRRGAAYSDLAMEALVRAIRPGVTERQLHAACAAAVLDAGGQLCFQWIGSTPMAAPRVIYPSQAPSNRVIEKGDLVVTEIAASYEWMAGQINRYVAVGAEPPARYSELHRLLVDLCHAVYAALVPGATAAEVARVAAPVFAAGYELDFIGIGRPTGAHTPYIVPSPPPDPALQRPFIANETFQVLPMPHERAEHVGLILGGLAVIRDGGAEALQRFPLDEFIVV